MDNGLFQRMSAFSRRQQQVFGLCCLFYGIWLCAVIISEQGREVAASPLRQPDPPDMRMYLDAPINPNRADAQELQLLPGIGPALAERIVAYRREHGDFDSLEALDQVKGIGPKTLQNIRHYLTFADPPQTF